MNKIKLVKRSENVNVTYSNDGEKTESLQNVTYVAIDEETGTELGSVDCHTGSFNVSFYGGIQSVGDSTALVEKMFAALNE